MLAQFYLSYHLFHQSDLFLLFTLFFEYLFYSSKEFRSLIHIDFHRLFYDACCSIFNELSALSACLSTCFLATALTLYHNRLPLSTPFFNFFAIFFSLSVLLFSITLPHIYCASCITFPPDFSPSHAMHL